MKKIVTWGDLKKAFKDNENISFKTKCIYIAKGYDKYDIEEEFLFIKDGLIFTKNGNLLKENLQVDGYYSGEFWSYTAVRNRTYQQMYDIIKLMLE